MDFFNTYGADIAMVIVALAVVGYLIYLVRTKQLDKVQKWLLIGVAQAESYFGSKTGEIKLRYVYNEFVVRFPVLKTFISFNTFKKMVDIALNELEEMIEKLDAVDAVKKEGE